MLQFSEKKKNKTFPTAFICSNDDTACSTEIKISMHDTKIKKCMQFITAGLIAFFGNVISI